MITDWVVGSEHKLGDVSQVPLFLRKPSRDIPLIDLSKATWVGPASIVALAAHAHRLVAKGYQPRFIPPINADLARYITRIGLKRTMSDLGISCDLPTVTPNNEINQKNLVELAHFSCERDVSKLIEILTYRKLDPDVLRPLAVSLSEMGNNVANHAEVDCGYMAAQVTSNGELLRFAVADSGVGILATLRSKGAESHKNAINMALQGISQTGRVGRGQGFRNMKAAIASVGGIAHLLSGDTRAAIHPEHTAFWQYGQIVSGTIFDAQIPLRTSQTPCTRQLLERNQAQASV